MRGKTVQSEYNFKDESRMQDPEINDAFELILEIRNLYLSILYVF